MIPKEGKKKMKGEEKVGGMRDELGYIIAWYLSIFVVC